MNAIACGRRIVEAMTCLVVAFFFSAFAIAGINKTREAACQAQCRNNLRKIGAGWSEFTKTNNHFPLYAEYAPKYEEPGKPYRTGVMLVESYGGWLWQIMPHMGKDNLAIYLQEKAESRRDAEANVIAAPVTDYFCPSRQRPRTFEDRVFQFGPGASPVQIKKATADYAASIGGMFMDGLFDDISDQNRGAPIAKRRAANPVREADVTDGLANTVFFTEWRIDADKYADSNGKTPNSPPALRLSWADGAGFYFSARCKQPFGLVDIRACSPKSDYEKLEQPGYHPNAGASHRDGLIVCAGDGSVRKIAYTIDPNVWVALCSRNDGSKTAWPAD